MRIVSLSPAATETLFALGAGPMIVAVDQFANFPDGTKRIAHLKDHQNVSVGEVRSHTPDLVLTGTVIQERLAASLKEAGLPVYHQDPRTIDAVFEAIRRIGVLVGAEEKADALVERMKEDVARLKTTSSLLPRPPRIYCEEWHDPPMASGNWVPDLLKNVGVKSYPLKAGELSRAISLEEVSAYDPDVIAISWCGAGALADKKLVVDRPGWSELRAVKEKNVFVIDDSLLNRPGPRLVDGARMLYGFAFQALHGRTA